MGESADRDVNGREPFMSLIVFLIVGLIAGWLAGQIVKGGGFG